MPIQNVKNGLAAITGIAVLVASLNSGSAMTLSSPTALRSDVSSQVEKIWYCRWNCGWRGPGWGAPAVVGGLAAGAIVGAAIASAPVYAAPAPVYVAPAPVYYGDPCWRRWIGPYGGVHWRRVC